MSDEARVAEDRPLADQVPCRQCGYDLRTHARGATCPECNEPVDASLAELKSWTPVRKGVVGASFGFLMLLMTTNTLALSPLGSGRHSDAQLFMTLWTTFGVGCLLSLLALATRRRVTLAAWLTLATGDHRCPQCGYLLRDLQSTACPECGHRLRLRLVTEDLAGIAALLTGVLPLAAVIGCSSIFLGLNLFFSPGWDPIGTLCVIALLLAIVLLVAWIRMVPRMRDRRQLWLAAAACWSAPPVFAILLYLTLLNFS